MASQAERDALAALVDDDDQKLRDALLIDIHAWLEAMQAAPQGQCVFTNPGASFDATANITIDPTP